jgi:tungstate transport system substrate-binding protein
MRHLLGLTLALSLLAISCRSSGEERPPEWIIMATSTLPSESGLLARLLPTFEKEYGVRVKVLDVGARASLRLAQRGEIDLALLDFDDASQLVNAGDGVDPNEFMYTSYLLVGPPDDPAGVVGLRSLTVALRKISQGQFSFYARADGSDTQDVEEESWQLAGVVPQGSWYTRLSRGAEEVLQAASNRQAYTITDPTTFNRLKSRLSLVAAVSNTKPLVRSFAAVPINPSKHPEAKYNWALRLSAFMASVPAQMVINDYLVADTGVPSFYAFSAEWKKYRDSLKLTPKAGGQ